MQNSIISYRGVVYPWQCDHMGHMNVMWYTGKFDEASWHFLSNLGLTRRILKETNRGLAAVQQNISYKKELYGGDLITVRTIILEVKEKTLRFLHTMTNDETGEEVAEAEITGVYMDSIHRRAVPLSDEVRERATLSSTSSSCFVDESIGPDERVTTFSGTNL